MNIVFVVSLAIFFFFFSSGLVTGVYAVRGGPKGQRNKRRRLFTTDGTHTLNGAAITATTPLSIFSSTDTSGTTEIYEFSPNPVPAGTTVTCTISCNVASSPTFQISINYGGLFTATTDGTVASGTSCPLTVSAATSTNQVGYVMVTQTSATGSVTSGSYTCVSTTTPSPTPAPTPAPTTPVPTPAPTPVPTHPPVAPVKVVVDCPHSGSGSGSKSNDSNDNDDYNDDDYNPNDDYDQHEDDEDCPSFAEKMASFFFGRWY